MRKSDLLELLLSESDSARMLVADSVPINMGLCGHYCTNTR